MSTTTATFVDEAHCYVDQNMQAPEIHPIAGGLASVMSIRCPDKQSPNEDAAALIPFDENSCVLAVADGVGGFPAGEQAAGLAIEALEASLEQSAREGQMLRTAILNGFENANRAVCELGVGAATTLAVVEIQDHTARPYHVGDSVILVVGGRGKMKLQSIPHSPVGFAVESGLLSEDDAMHHEDRHLVSNVLGTPDMRIDVGSVLQLAPRDTVLLASDGLSDNLHVSEIVEQIRKGPLEAGTRRLASVAVRRMTQAKSGQPSKPDDLTVLLFRLRRCV